MIASVSRPASLALLLAVTVLFGGCRVPVRPPPEPAPTERPVPPLMEKPAVRPPLRVGYPERIALLLPLSGRHAAAGVAVRDGFLAAWFQQESVQQRRPTVRIYDVAGTDGGSALLRAVNDGAQFVVGPLLKDDVAAAAALADGRVPVLALNFLAEDEQTPPHFYQFALSPEDEARQVARRAVAEGRGRGLALVPIGDWGTRVLNAFEQELTRLGGTLTARSAYDPEESDHSPVIQQLFRLGDSRERHARLVGMLGIKLEFEPRSRGDVQFVFVAAQPMQGRQLRPQLKFHYVGHVPMYSTSDVFEANETANIDLDRVRLPLMPWVLGGNPLAAHARSTVEAAWPGRAERRGHLYAFGYDAWQLIPELTARQPRAPAGRTREMIDGVTGRLYLETDGRIHRDLDWAEIRDGRPRRLPD